MALFGVIMGETGRIDGLIDDLLQREGGYSNHRHDTGGKTRFGITEATARANGYAGPMRDLPLSLARQIYRRIYWDRPGFSKVARYAPDLAAELFDIAVNMGPGTATGFLQRSLNALNRQAKDYPDLQVDRDIGPKTLSALGRYIAARGKPGELVLTRAVDSLQGARYIALAESRPANESFLYGWLANRVS